MKKLLTIAIFSVLLISSTAYADFNRNLTYGAKGANVSELQEFLTDYGCYTGPISGNFYSLTSKAVKCFQAKERISPTGNFYVATRTKANEILTSQTDNSDEPTVADQLQNPDLLQFNDIPKTYTPPVPDPVNPWTTPVAPDWCKNINGNQDIIPDGFVRVGDDCFLRKDVQPNQVINTNPQPVQSQPVQTAPATPLDPIPQPIITTPPPIEIEQITCSNSNNNYSCASTYKDSVIIKAVKVYVVNVTDKSSFYYWVFDKNGNAIFTSDLVSGTTQQVIPLPQSITLNHGERSQIARFQVPTLNTGYTYYRAVITVNGVDSEY